MNIVYASSFKNEQVASGSPVRMVVTGPAQGASQKVDGNGYWFQPNILNGNQYTLDPGVSFTGLRYRCYSVSWTPQSTAAAVLNSLISVFGFSLPAEYKKDQVVRKLVVLQDTQTQTSRCYANGRYVSDGTVQGTITVTGASGSAVYPSYYITDLVVGESDTEEKFSASLVDQVLTEVANEWEFNGATLIESLDKTNTTTVEPSASVYYEGKTFTVAPEDTDKPLLVEYAQSSPGDLDVWGLVINDNPPATLAPSQTTGEAILEPTDSIKVGRVSIVTPPLYSPPNILQAGLFATPQLNKVNGSSLVVVGSGPTVSLTNSNRNQYSSNFGSGCLQYPITPIGLQDYTIETWMYLTGATGDIKVISSTGPSSTGFTASNLMLVAYIGSDSVSLYTGATGGIQGVVVIGDRVDILNTWVHVAMQRTGTTVGFYANGVLAGTVDQNFSFTSSTLTVGCYSDNVANRRFSSQMSYYGLTVGSNRYPLEGFSPEYPPY